jgi:hypothetical protein
MSMSHLKTNTSNKFHGFDDLHILLHGAIIVNTIEVCFGKLYQSESNVEIFSLLKFYYYVIIM